LAALHAVVEILPEKNPWYFYQSERKGDLQYWFSIFKFADFFIVFRLLSCYSFLLVLVEKVISYYWKHKEIMLCISKFIVLVDDADAYY
jgi:hypothetical protein